MPRTCTKPIGDLQSQTSGKQGTAAQIRPIKIKNQDVTLKTKL
jgi:hypothetical protein